MNSRDNKNGKYLNLKEGAAKERIGAEAGTHCCPGGVDSFKRSQGTASALLSGT